MPDTSNANDTIENGYLASGASVAVVANPRAGRAETALEEALAVLENRGLTVSRLPGADTVSGFRSAVAAARREADCVILAGGDGTLNQALPSLIGPGAPLGVLPLGTANDFARTLGIPLAPAAAAEALVAARQRWIDVGDADGRYFLNVAHAGLGVAARHALSAQHKRRWKQLSYPFALIAGLRRHRAFRVTLGIDGEWHTLKVRHIGVGNGRFFGGGVPVAEEAHVDDGTLNVYAVITEGFVGMLRAGAAVWSGRRGPGVWRSSGQCIEIRTGRAHTLMADGETIGRTPVTICLHDRVLPVLAAG